MDYYLEQKLTCRKDELEVEKNIIDDCVVWKCNLF